MGPDAAAARQAERLRKDGNECYRRGRFGAAIDAYTEAITLCPNVPVYWANRALCHRKRNYKVEEDSRKALELDHDSVKAITLCPNVPMYRTNRALCHRKRNDWQKVEELQSLKEACGMVLKEKFASDASMTEGFLDELAKSHLEQVNAVGQVFQKAAEADVPAEVPDYLCCKSTLDIYRDPVITPSGITYERAVLLEHLNKVGKFDPITHERLEPSQLVPNLAIKAAVQAYLDEHGWAYKWD